MDARTRTNSSTDPQGLAKKLIKKAGTVTRAGFAL
jgi:hypothetical protein